MNYFYPHTGIFLQRHNRFIAEILLNEKKELVHVKNTGRCQELLIPGAEVIVDKAQNPQRKTGYSLIQVKKNNQWFNLDSQAPNQILAEALDQKKIAELSTFTYQREQTWGQSRLDFKLWDPAQTIWAEVKGVTLEKEGIALFPDAPTQRGTRHINELIKAKSCGYQAYLFFILQFENATGFKPNIATDPNFATALLQAKKQGVEIRAYDCHVQEAQITLNKPIPLFF